MPILSFIRPAAAILIPLLITVIIDIDIIYSINSLGRLVITLVMTTLLTKKLRHLRVSLSYTVRSLVDLHAAAPRGTGREVFLTFAKLVIYGLHSTDLGAQILWPVLLVGLFRHVSIHFRLIFLYWTLRSADIFLTIGLLDALSGAIIILLLTIISTIIVVMMITNLAARANIALSLQVLLAIQVLFIQLLITRTSRGHHPVVFKFMVGRHQPSLFVASPFASPPLFVFSRLLLALLLQQDRRVPLSHQLHN